MGKKTKSTIKITARLEKSDDLHFAVVISQGTASSRGSKKTKDWFMSSDGSVLLIGVGDEKPYVMNLLPILKKVLAAEHKK